MDSILPFLSAAGLGGAVGAVVTTLLSSWLTRRNALDERRFREKKEAYLNLLQAIHRSEIEATTEAAKTVGHCINVTELVASALVRTICVRLLETNPSIDGARHPDRPAVLVDLKTAMRVDLGF
jgi:hypothetical protein